MRRPKNHIKLRAKDSDVVCLTAELLGEERVIDVDRLRGEMIAAEQAHQYTSKAFKGWDSIPLRSAGGVTGITASGASGVNASSDPATFEDTDVMQHCPYIKELVDEIAGVGGGVLKVRLLRLEAGRSIGQHIDHFTGDNSVIRMHIPIVTDPKVIFQVNMKDYQLLAGQLYAIDVTQLHSVRNKSKKVDRIHLVFDVLTTPRIREAFIIKRQKMH